MDLIQWAMTPAGARAISEFVIVCFFVLIIIGAVTQRREKNNGR